MWMEAKASGYNSDACLYTKNIIVFICRNTFRKIFVNNLKDLLYLCLNTHVGGMINMWWTFKRHLFAHTPPHKYYNLFCVVISLIKYFIPLITKQPKYAITRINPLRPYEMRLFWVKMRSTVGILFVVRYLLIIWKICYIYA